MSVLTDCHLYLTLISECVCFTTVGDAVQQVQCPRTEVSIGFADNRMVLHVGSFSMVQRLKLRNVVIKSCYADHSGILVILCHYMAYTDTTVDVWIDAGRDSDNS